MTAGPVPCWSCGRPIQPGSLTCPACGVFVDAPTHGTESTVAAGIPESIGVGELPDGPGPGGIVPLKLPGSYLSPSAVHQGAAPVSSVPDAPSAAVPAAPMAMPLAGKMPLAGTPEPGTGGPGMFAGGAVPARPMPSSSTDNPSAPGEIGVAAPGQGGTAAPGQGGTAAGARPGEAPLFADLPFDAPNSLSGWLVMVGSAVAAVSFLLPWAPGIVNYTSSWGLSNLANLPILAILIATVILVILPNRVPLWIRNAVLPLIGGSLFLGLLWPYVLGDFGAVFGSIAGAAGAVVLIVGGSLAVAPRAGKAPVA